MLTTVDIKNLKLPPSSHEKKDLMDKLRNSIRNKKNAFTRLVGSDSKPGLYPQGLKAAIQGAEPLEGSMTEEAKAEIESTQHMLKP